MCVVVEVGRAPFRLCYLGVWYCKSALQLSTCSLTDCSFMAFTTDIYLHIICVLSVEYHKVQSWAPRFLGQQSSLQWRFDAVNFLQWDLNGSVMRFGSYCCDTDKRHILDSTSKTSWKDLPQQTFPSVTTVHTQGIMEVLLHRHNSPALYELSNQFVTCFVDQKCNMPHM